MLHSDRPMEVAMTHRFGGGGVAERFMRPAPVLTVVERMMRWPVVPESCQSCHSLPAARFTSGLPLCGRCHANRAQRLGRVFDPSGVAARAARAEDESDAQLHGYAIRFNEKSGELFGFFEVIRPSAADRMVAEQPDMRALWNHDSSEPIGRISAGTLRAVKRTKGVWVEIDPPLWARRHVESVERRDVTGMSFGFYVFEDDWWIEDGIPHREVLDMEIVEVSAVSFPAYPSTTLKAVRGSARSSIAREQQTAERLRLAR